MSVQQIRNYAQETINPNYVPPVSWFVLGRKAFHQCQQIESHWPADMKAGWEAAERACFISVAKDSYIAAATLAASIH